jgi:hypothetical protein
MHKDLVFIGSPSRTGTQFLGHGLGDVIEDCFSVHEPDMLFGTEKDVWQQIREFGVWHMLIGRLAGVTGVRVLGQRLLTGSISPQTAIDRIRRSRESYHESIAEGLVVESHGPWWYFADYIGQLWPGARLVGVIRDPRTWIRSCLNKGGRYDNRDWAGMLPPGRLTPAKLQQRHWADRWSELPPLGKLAWEWRTAYTHLSRAAESNAACRLVRFEDLFTGDRSALTDLVYWIAAAGHRTYRVREERLRDFGSVVRNARHGRAQDWPDWNGADVRLVDELCGPLMREYGYGEEPEWRQKLRA